jgi:hypothetical protein
MMTLTTDQKDEEGLWLLATDHAANLPNSLGDLLCCVSSVALAHRHHNYLQLIR